MCGIFAIHKTNEKLNIVHPFFQNLKNRGPDSSELLYVTDDTLMGFHRLNIVNLTDEGKQPYSYTSDAQKTWCVCNGEIYNYKMFNLTSAGSDCHVILPLLNVMKQRYTDYTQSLHALFNALDGVFATIIWDGTQLIVSRDPFGVRPLFIGKRGDSFAFSSEMKGFHDLCTDIKQFPPGSFWTSGDNTYHRYYEYVYPELYLEKELILTNIRSLLTTAVQKRLMSERSIGCLLSGGLDSSLITSIVVREMKKHNKDAIVQTFTIGMPGSPDLDYADKVADFLGTKHHRVEIGEDEFLKALHDVIYTIESYDTTTVRASVGNYLIGKYIKQNTDCTVIFNGDGSDEQSGYLYLKNAPSESEFKQECIKLLSNICYFDVLRSDRCISSKWSLEARTPFLDKTFVAFYMSIPSQFKMYTTDIEKKLLREAFDDKDQPYLPQQVLWRQKEAFSDGCSSNGRSWHTVIAEHVDTFFSDHEFATENNYTYNKPVLKESYFYRKIYEIYYKNTEIIPYYWLPKWTKSKDPSARTLEHYQRQSD